MKKILKHYGKNNYLLTVKINYISKSAIDLSVNIKDIFYPINIKQLLTIFQNK